MTIDHSRLKIQPRFVAGGVLQSQHSNTYNGKQSIDGRIVYTSFTTANNMAGFVWDADKVNSGMYYYLIKLNGSDLVSGKLVKL